MNCPFCEENDSLKFVKPLSTWTIRKYVCTSCEKGLAVKTSAGKLTEVAPLAIAGAVLLKMFVDPLDFG